MSDIHVDPDVLSDFARALSNFQDTLEQELQSLNSEWSRCSESFTGRKRDEFEENFDSTCKSIAQTLEDGQEAVYKLHRYQEAVRNALD
jgi:uncharacterized protein YukE